MDDKKKFAIVDMQNEIILDYAETLKEAKFIKEKFIEADEEILEFKPEYYEIYKKVT